MPYRKKVEGSGRTNRNPVTVRTCSNCSGRGWTNQKNSKGFVVSVVCSRCGGDGYIYSK